MNIKKLYKKIAGFMIFTYAISFSVNTYASEINTLSIASLPNLANVVGTTGAISSQSNILAASAVTTAQSVYSQTYTGTQNEVTSSVFSLPADTVTGQLDATISGNTRVNLLGNDGDCEDVNKWTTWRATLGLDSTNKVFGNNGIKFTTTVAGQGNMAIGISNLKLDTNKYYMFSAYIKAGTTNAGLVSDGDWRVSPLVSNTSNFVRVCIKLSPSEIAKVTCLTIYMPNASAIGQYSYVDGVMANEISASDYKLSDDQLMGKYPYVNGAASTNTMRIKSVGKNLFSNKYFEDLGSAWCNYGTIAIENNKIKIVSTGDDAHTASYGHPYFLPLELRKFAISIPQVNTIYFSCKREGLSKGTSRDVIFFYDEGYNFMSLTNIFGVNGETTEAVTVPKGAKYLSIRLGTVKAGETAYYSNFMLSSENIPYEQYKESSTYTQGLLSLGYVRDEINLTENTLIKRVNKVDIGSSTGLVNFNNTQFSTIAYAYITGWTTPNNVLTNTTNYMSRNNDFVFNSVGIFVDNGLPQVCIGNDGTLWYAIPKNKIGGTTGYTNDLNGFVKYITDTKTTLTYQLAQQQTYKISTQPLIAYTGGTVVIEPAVKDSATNTSTGISVANKGLPISFIESVYKLNGSIMMPVDLSKVHIAANGTSFTIEGAKAGEIYEYVYQYDKSLTTLPTIKYSVPKDQGSQAEGNTEMIQLLMKKIDLLEEKLKALENDRLTQYEYDANGRLVKKAKQ